MPDAQISPRQTAATELAALGRRLREFRKMRGWTLAEMSAQTRLAASTLSKVENGQISPGYDNLMKIAGALGIDISQLLSEGPGQQPNGRRLLTRRDGGRFLSTPNYTYEYLGAELARKRMITLHTEVKTTSLAEFGPLQKHPGEEFVWVSTGRILIHTEFYEPVELAEGNSLYFNSTMGHAFTRIGDAPAFILNVISAGEDSSGLFPVPASSLRRPE